MILTLFRRLKKWLVIAVLLLLCAGITWFAFSPQLEVMFARNVLLYRIEKFWGVAPATATLNGTLSGEVVESSGAFSIPLADATVIISDPDGRTLTTQTDRSGRFKIQAPPGVYVPLATKAGFADATYQNFLGLKSSVEVRANQISGVDIKLQRAPTRVQRADDSLKFFDETRTHTDVTQPTEVLRRGFSFVRAGTVLTASYVYEPLNSGYFPILLVIYPCGAYPCSTLSYDILSATLAAQGFVVVTFSPQRGVNVEADMDDLIKLIAHIKAGQLSARGNTNKLALLAGSLTSIHVWRVAQLAPADTMQAIIILGGVSDILLMRQRFEENKLRLEPPVIYELVSYALIGLGRPNLNPELYVRYSPVYHVDALPRIPLALMHGEKDKTVPFEQTPHFSEALKAHGVPHEVYVFPNQEHYLQLSPPTPDELDMLAKVVGFLRRALNLIR